MQRIQALQTIEKVGQEVLLAGFVNSRRDHGKIIFLDLRDESGLVQIVVTPKQEKSYQIASSLSGEDVVKIVGVVNERPKSNINPDLETGKLEVVVKTLEIISKAKPLPIPIDTDGYEIEEAARFKYRYIDLRRKRLMNNLKLRHKVLQIVRESLEEKGFTEVETPYLSKTTPEGARDFLVPSRLKPGNFYALAQAPQQYKQLLMVAGLEKYYQIARAFRDEDLRADRQFEHTQIDLEMAYVEREDVLRIVEELCVRIASKLGKKIFKQPFPVFSYHEAMKKFQADKFDLRDYPDEKSDNFDKTKEKDKNTLAFAFVVDFPLFERDEKENRWTFSHNPFTSPKIADIDKLMDGKDIASISSLQYDLVCNGYEVGSGSIRINDPAVQRKVFQIMGYKDNEIDEKFGHILEAYTYGAPTHGGIAIGLDRLVAIIAGEDNIREVIAFPVSSSGQTSVMDAPSPVDEDILKELGLKVEVPPQ